MSLEMAHKVILPPKKNYIPQFLKQLDINSYKRNGLTLLRNNGCGTPTDDKDTARHASAVTVQHGPNHYKDTKP